MFQGFSPETIDFLWGIRMNNNREWFQAHKQQYVETLYEPMKALGRELFQPYLEKTGSLLKVSRIYRDARLHYPDPYKESLCLWIRPDTEQWAENPCLFFELRPEGASFGFSLWRPRPADMERFRREISAHPEEFLALMETVQESAGIPVTAQRYKRLKNSPDPRLDPYFSWKWDIGCIKTLEAGPALFTPELKDTVAALFESTTGLYDYFARILS